MPYRISTEEHRELLLQDKCELTTENKALRAENARLREAVEWACAHEQIPSWPYFIAELRRRAKEGK